MKTSTVLKKALNVLEGDGSRPAWTKNTMSRNKYRHSVRPTNPNAVKFCAYGAVCRVLGENAEDAISPEYRAAESYLKSELPAPSSSEWGSWFGRSLDAFNDRDTTKFEDVRQLFKRAIKAAKHDGN